MPERHIGTEPSFRLKLQEDSLLPSFYESRVTVTLLRARHTPAIDPAATAVQQSFRCGDRRYLPQRLAPKLFRFGRQSPALLIVELQPPVTHLFAKDPVLLDQICDHFLLMPAHPAGNRRHEKRKRAQGRAHRRIL